MTSPNPAAPPVTDCNQIQTIGLFAHELGHSLGLPDLYDTDVGNGGVGTWSAMASSVSGGRPTTSHTPPHYDAWSKAFEGWVKPDRALNPPTASSSRSRGPRTTRRIRNCSISVCARSGVQLSV